MTNTKKNELKERREWQDLLTEKKAYLKRKQEEEDAAKEVFTYRPRNFRLGVKPDSIDEI